VNDETQNIDGRTKRALDMALARKQISRASYDAVLASELSLADAKRLGRDGAPDAPDATEDQETTTEAPPEPSPSLCWCGMCGLEVRSGRRWRQGHDARGKSLIQKAVAEGTVDELPKTLRQYGRERGLI
jgi:hypothetical protein